MDDDESKPGVTQIPLIHDLAFNPLEPLEAPGKRSTPSDSPSRKSGPYPPGYDPDTVDLFEDIIESVESANKDGGDIQKPVVTQGAGNPISELDENLRAELSGELDTILEHLKDHPET